MSERLATAHLRILGPDMRVRDVLFDGTVVARCGEFFDENCGDCLVCFPDCPEAAGLAYLWTDADREHVAIVMQPLFDVLTGAHRCPLDLDALDSI